MLFNLTLSNEVFTDEAGNQLPYVAYTMHIDDQDFKLVPKKTDKRLIAYLITKHNILRENKFFTKIEATQESFRDVVKRKSIDYVACTMELCGRKFRLQVRQEDRTLFKYLLEEKGFFIDDDLSVDGEDDE